MKNFNIFQYSSSVKAKYSEGDQARKHDNERKNKHLIEKSCL